MAFDGCFGRLYGFENDYNDNSKDSSRRIRSNSATNSTIENSGVLLADDRDWARPCKVFRRVDMCWKQTPFPTLKKPFKRILVACPASLVGNWGNESKKWIGNVRAQCVTADGGAENVARALQKWIETNENVEEKQMQSSFDSFRF